MNEDVITIIKYPTFDEYWRKERAYYVPCKNMDILKNEAEMAFKAARSKDVYIVGEGDGADHDWTIP